MRVDPRAPAEDEGVRASFAKAESREPAWGVAAGFVPPASRPVFRAWIALLGELRECAFELSDPRVTALKAGWWAEEFDGLARGAARHPVTRVLVRHRLPWDRLPGPLLATAGELDPAGDTEAALRALAPLAGTLVDLEARLFDGPATAPDSATRALGVHWLRHRLERGLEAADRARVPLAVFARHGLRREQLAAPEADALRRDWAAALLAALPPPQAGWPLARHLAVDIDRTALRSLAATGSARGLVGFAALWRAWRSARNAALQVRAPVAPGT